MNNSASAWPLLHWFRYSATKFMLQKRGENNIPCIGEKMKTVEMAHTDIGLNEN